MTPIGASKRLRYNITARPPSYNNIIIVTTTTAPTATTPFRRGPRRARENRFADYARPPDTALNPATIVCTASHPVAPCRTTSHRIASFRTGHCAAETFVSGVVRRKIFWNSPRLPSPVRAWLFCIIVIAVIFLNARAGRRERSAKRLTVKRFFFFLHPSTHGHIDASR